MSAFQPDVEGLRSLASVLRNSTSPDTQTQALTQQVSLVSGVLRGPH